jgi:hypothetical protein
LNTTEQYEQAIEKCKDIFVKKVHDYGTSWRVLRMISIVDQIYIKALRIRTIQEKKQQMIADDIAGEFMAMANYGIIALIQLDLGNAAGGDLSAEEAERLYEDKAKVAYALMLDKNHDYGEAWRDMSQESFVDLILVKLLRIRQILGNDGKTLVSEGIDANFIDIINYSIFGLILISEGKH